MHDGTRETDPASGEDRLDSWKEIAAYLKQGVRTVQRWEREEGLPVHRPPGKKRGTVYAFAGEVDRWFRARAGEDQRKVDSRRFGPATLLTAAALASLIAGIWLERGFKEPIAPSTRMEQALDSVAPGWGRISPDGRTLAYRETKGGFLYLRDMRSRESRLIVDAQVHPQLSWSPDGAAIAYRSKRGNAFRLETFDMETGQSSVLRTGSSTDEAMLPVGWGPEKRTLLGSTSRYDRYTFVSTRDGSLRGETTLEGTIREPALSPNGRALAYAVRSGRSYDLAIAPLDREGEPIRVTAFSGNEQNPLWSADGRTLLFVRIYGMSTHGRAEIWGVSVDPETMTVRGEPFRVAETTDMFGEIPPVMARDGSLYWASRESGSRVQVLEVDPQTGEPGSVRADFPIGSTAKHWAPDEPARLYFWDPSVRWQVLSDVLAFRERDIQTGRERLHQIPWPNLAWSSFAYNADHSEAVFGVREDDGYALYHYVVATNTTSKVTSGRELLSGGLAHAGGRIGFLRRGADRRNMGVGVVDIETKAVRMLYKGDLVGLPAWSPDDREVAFGVGACLYSADVQTEEAERIVCAPETAGGVDADSKAWQRPISGPAWSPDGERLALALDNPLQQRAELWIVQRATGEKRVIWQGEEGYGSRAYGPSWSTNGRFIAFTLATQPPVQIWAIQDPNLTPDVS